MFFFFCLLWGEVVVKQLMLEIEKREDTLRCVLHINAGCVQINVTFFFDDGTHFQCKLI